MIRFNSQVFRQFSLFFFYYEGHWTHLVFRINTIFREVRQVHSYFRRTVIIASNRWNCEIELIADAQQLCGRENRSWKSTGMKWGSIPGTLWSNWILWGWLKILAIFDSDHYKWSIPPSQIEHLWWIVSNAMRKLTYSAFANEWVCAW